jgi:hypothetical protein
MMHQTRSDYEFNVEEFEQFLTIISTPINEENIFIQILEKLTTLSDLGLLSEKDAYTIYQYFYSQKDTITNDKDMKDTQPVLPGVINLFSGTFFGLKGEIENVLLYLPVFQLPFFDDNITGLFMGLGRPTGQGSVFTLGVLGLKYNYDFDRDQYDFPHYPIINGLLVGFTGVLIQVNAGELLPEEYQGTYTVGVGMSVFTMWTTES